MRRKEVVKCFFETFSEFMFNNHYKFYKNCFVKYQNNVFNRVSIWTQKTMDTVSFDIIHFCRPIYEDFISIEDENENSDFSLARIVFSKNVYDNIKWEFEYRNIKDMVLRIKTAFNLYKDFFPYFNCEDIEDYNTKSQEYYKKINDKPELDSYMKLNYWEIRRYTVRINLN